MHFKKVRISPNPEGSAHYKRWEDETGEYRIEWRNRMMGVTLDPAYYGPMYKYVRDDGKVIWAPVDRGKRFRKLTTAMVACEYHAKHKGNQ